LGTLWCAIYNKSQGNRSHTSVLTRSLRFVCNLAQGPILSCYFTSTTMVIDVGGDITFRDYTPTCIHNMHIIFNNKERRQPPASVPRRARPSWPSSYALFSTQLPSSLQSSCLRTPIASNLLRSLCSESSVHISCTVHPYRTQLHATVESTELPSSLARPVTDISPRRLNTPYHRMHHNAAPDLVW
jgi:hypothetical protein